MFVRERREDCGDGSDDTTEETEDHAGGRLYPDPAQSLPAPSLSVEETVCVPESLQSSEPREWQHKVETQKQLLIMSLPSQAPV